MKILTYNVYGFRLIHRLEDGRRKFANYIIELDPDIICIQEAYKYIPIDITNVYKHQSSYWFGGLNILSKTPIYNRKILKLDEDKGCLYSMVNDLNIFNIHLDNFSEKTRLKQYNEIFEFIKDIVKENDFPILLCGDFNSINKEFYSSKKWKDMLTYEQEYTSEDSDVYNSITSTFYDTYLNKHKNPSTSIYDRQVDYIFTDFIPKTSCKIMKNFIFSDHSPVIFEFEI